MLSCWDRVVIQGTLPGFSYADGMTSYLYANKLRIFDYARFADQIRTNAERLATEAGIKIQFVRKSSARKEDIVRAILDERGNGPGLVAVLSAMEACASYRPGTTRRHIARS